MPDAYTVRARIAPAALLVAPAVALLAALGLSPTGLGLAAFGATGAFAAIGSGHVGDRGRSLQGDLFQRWGGSPTTQRMRWKGDEQEAAISARHDCITSMTGIAMPTAAEEATDPSGADRRYERATSAVRAILREDESNRILADVNAEYGFRRNSLGVRSQGIRIALLGAIASAIVCAVSAGPRSQGYLVACGVAIVAGLFWWRVVTEAWVRIAAERYGDQFVETLTKHARSPSS